MVMQTSDLSMLIGDEQRIAIPSVRTIEAISYILLIRKLLERKSGNKVVIYLVKNDRTFGSGVAYSTKINYQIFNIKAGAMSLFLDEPEYFIKWIKQFPDIKNVYSSKNLSEKYIFFLKIVYFLKRNKNLFLTKIVFLSKNISLETF